jgi:hypothetical protein
MTDPVLAEFPKDPDDDRPFAIDWTDALPPGETITSVVWAVPAGITNVSTSNTATTATIRLSGGTDGTTYRVGCKITTMPSGYKLERSIGIRVAHR